MGLNADLRRFAFGRPRAFPVLGRGGGEPWRRLLDAQPVIPVRAPRDADLLVLAGELPAAWNASLLALFETLALPRQALWLQPDWYCRPPDLPLGASLAPAALARWDWRRLQDRLLNPNTPGNRALLPDLPPFPWSGRGDHGQGGKGMMGGKPYGRPMAMTIDDPDGLALDDVPTWLGPWFPGLPSGLVLKLQMQGDRVRDCAALDNAFPPGPAPQAHRPPALTAVGQPVPIRELEQARLYGHLCWLAEFLPLVGQPDLARDLGRQRRAADPGAVARLLDRVPGPLLKRLTRGVGVIDRQQATDWQLTGPVARASGLAIDARAGDPDYQALGFQAITDTAGDVAARLRLRLAECRQSLELMARAGDARSRAAEGVRGGFIREQDRLLTPSRRNLAALQPLLPGLEWLELVLTVASLDLDMEEAAWR